MYSKLYRRGKFSVTKFYCLAVVGIRTREFVVQVRDQNLHTTNRQNDSEARRQSYPDGNVIETRSYHFSSVRELY